MMISKLIWVHLLVFSIVSVSFGQDRDANRQEPARGYFYESTYLSRSGSPWNSSTLKDFATRLKRNEGVVGYVIVYAGKKTYEGEAECWIARLRAFLSRDQGVNLGKITFIDGGHRESADARLFVLKRSDIAPKPTPTVERDDVELIAEKDLAKRRPKRC